jgi:RNA polymerase sigma-70 factor (ECF subfamily)
LIARDMSCSLRPRTLSAVAAAGAEVESDADLEQRFDAFVNGYRERAVQIAWRLLGGDAAAEDVAQEAFARAYRGLARFRGDAKLSTWFYRILVNEVRRHQRWRMLRDRRTRDREPDAVPDPITCGDALRSDLALRRRIGEAIAALPRGQREAFVLVHLEGLSVSEAASATGRAVGTMKSHLHRGLASLRKRLADLAPDRERSAEETR